MWLINNWERIVNIISNIVSSVGKIAIGQLGEASRFIETTLVEVVDRNPGLSGPTSSRYCSTSPVLRDFQLARLIGLGNVSERVKKIILRMRKPVDDLIDKIIGFIKGKLKNFRGKGSGKNKTAKTKDDEKHGTLTKKEAKKKLEVVSKKVKPILKKKLKDGVSKRQLDKYLKSVKKKYNLTDIQIDQSGNIKFMINPYIILDDPKGKKLHDSQLAKLLMPVFEQAEQEYAAHLLNSPRGAQIAQAGRNYSAGNKDSMQGLTNFEKSIVKSNNYAPKGRLQTEPKVSEFIPGANRKGKINNIDDYANTVSKNGKLKLGILPKIKSNIRKYKLTDSEVLSVLTGSVHRLETKIADLKDKIIRSNGITSKTAKKPVVVFMDYLRRAVYLTQAFEPSRTKGIYTSTSTAYTMANSGKVTPNQVMGAHGNMAPMTPRGAAPESGVVDPNNKEQVLAAQTKARRVGRTFGFLYKHTKDNAKESILVPGSNYDLRQLSDAIKLFLSERLSKKANPDDLEASIDILKGEITQLIKAYD